MNYIQKSFLASDRKLIPFNPTKVNYGFSSVDGKDLERIKKLLNVNDSKNLFIKNLPSSVPFVVILLRLPRNDEIEILGDDNTQIEDIKQQNLKVMDVQSAPPGISSVSFTLDPGEQYYVYILSSKYQDGYIKQGDLSNASLISSDDDYINRFIFRIDGKEKVFVDSIKFKTSNLNSDGTENVWYDFQDNYTNDFLIWDDPQPWLTYMSDRPQGNQSWLVYMRNMYSELQASVFRGFDLVGFNGKSIFDSTVYSRLNQSKELMTLNDIVKIYYSRDDAARVWSKWKEWRDYFVDGDSDEREKMYYAAQFSDSDDLAEDQTAGDPVPQFKSQPSKADVRAAIAVIYKFIFKAYYDMHNESLWRVINRSRTQTLLKLFNAISNKLSTLTALELETSHPVIGPEAKEIFDRLKLANDVNTNERDDYSRDLIEYLKDKLSSYDEIFPERKVSFVSDFFDQSKYSNEDEFDDLIINGFPLNKHSAWTFVVSYYKRISDGLEEIDNRIRDLGDGVVIPPPESAHDLPELAHEATLQNIRYLKGILDSFVKDSWTESTNFNSYILKKIDELRNETLTLTARANTLVSITNARINNNDVEVLWKRYEDNDWNILPSGVIDHGNGVKSIDVSEIREIGKYMVLIRPKGKEIRITDIISDALLVTPDLDDFKNVNYFFGWNIEFTEPGSLNLPIGEQRMIVGSTFKVGAHELLVSPNIFGVQDFSDQVYARIWKNSFIPIMVDLEITNHNIQTLAYASYGKQEFNTDTGVLTIYDFAGRPFKKFTVGERTKAEEDYNNIEFKDPI